jgi:inorganic triphosphatase YgiF
VTDRYIDTAVEGGRLEAAGCRARLRTVRRRTELTVKRDDVRRGPINARVELVGPATRALDSRRWPTSGARDELIRLAGQASFEVVATLHQRREIRRLSRGGTVVELSLDELRAGAAGRSAPRRWELEAELVRGDRHALGELGAALQAVPGVGEPLGSKLAFARAAAPRDS